MNNVGDLLRQFTCWRDNDGLDVCTSDIDLLQYSDAEGTGLSCSRLGLGDCIFSLDQWHDSFLLDGGRFFETIGVNASEKFITEAHIVEC